MQQQLVLFLVYLAKIINELYDTTAALEKLGNKNLVLDVTGADYQRDLRQCRTGPSCSSERSATEHVGYPSIVNLAKIAGGDYHLQAALAAMFTMKYGSIVVMERMTYAEALPLYGLRQNVFTDPQKPMRVEPGIYPMNGGDENSLCLLQLLTSLLHISLYLESWSVPVFRCNLDYQRCRRTYPY